MALFGVLDQNIHKPRGLCRKQSEEAKSGGMQIINLKISRPTTRTHTIDVHTKH